jgi:hypothetical protein
MTKKLPAGDDGSRMSAARDFPAWPGDPFAGMTRKWGQTDYACNNGDCGKLGRHPWSPDVPLGWWFLYDRRSDVVHIVCRPHCAAVLSGLMDAKAAKAHDIKALVKKVVAAGWRYRSPEKADPNEIKVRGLDGGWGNSSI